MTRIEENTRFLLILNLSLQLLDGTMSYGLLALAPVEPNLSLNAAVISWRLIGGLFYNKVLASTLLMLIYMLRHRREVMVANALTIIASVYTCSAAVSVWQYGSR